MSIGIYSNMHQGEHKKVLAVCSANMLRSPTIAHVLSAEPYNYNTRSAGTAAFALIPVTYELLLWADEIVCADTEHVMWIRNKMMDDSLNIPIINLKIEDIYDYRDPKLVELIHQRYQEKANVQIA